MTTLTTSHIEKISDDILFMIIGYLGTKSIIKLRECNRRCRNILTTRECINLIHKEWSTLFKGLYDIVPKSAQNIYIFQEPSLYLAFEIQMKDTWKKPNSSSNDIWYYFYVFIDSSYIGCREFEKKGLEFIEDQQKRR